LNPFKIDGPRRVPLSKTYTHEKRWAAPKFSHTPLGTWRKVAGLEALNNWECSAVSCTNGVRFDTAHPLFNTAP
jgi:hypothetical protein